MTVAPRPVRQIGDALPYADGAEDELLGLVSAARDRSSGSDELAAGVHDWPTLYHLSRARTHLLRPIEIRPGDRVLDVGAGTGAMARYVAEQGAHVTAIEGSRARAEITAARCAGFDQVDVLCGSVHDLDDGEFDLILVIGVLEYAWAAMGGAAGPSVLLSRLRSLLSADGAVVIAIENQLGLKYLLGYDEDHLGVPWIGLAGYEATQVRTWSQAGLTRLLDEAGLESRRWLYPFPDYKLPVAVLSEAAYELDDAVNFVDQVVGAPVDHSVAGSPLVVDERLGHRVLVDAQIGPETANSFLVIAGGSHSSVARRCPADVLAWRYTRERRRRWMQESVISAAGPVDRVLHRRWLYPGERDHGWLRQVATGEEPYVVGPNLEQELLSAARAYDRERAIRVLAEWHEWLHRHCAEGRVALPVADSDQHPYLPAATTEVLPEDMLDSGLDNVVRGPDGLVFVDREWRVRPGVSYELARYRGLWKLAQAVIGSGAPHPWPIDATVRQLALVFAELLGVTVDDETPDRWCRAEAELLAKVTGAAVDDAVASLEAQGGTRRHDRAAAGSAPYQAMQAQVAELTERAAYFEVRHAEAVAAAEQAVAERERLVEELHAIQAELDAVSASLDSFRRLIPVEAARSVWDRVRRRDRVEREAPAGDETA